MILRRTLILAAVLVIVGSLGVAWWVWRQGLVAKAMGRPTTQRPVQAAAPTPSEQVPNPAPPPTQAPAAGVPEVRPAIAVSGQQDVVTPSKPRPGTVARAEAAAVPAKPLSPEWQAVAGSQTFRVYVWSLEPVAEGLKPPAALLEEEWRDAALTNEGGAALLKDRTVVAWHMASPGAVMKFNLPEGATDLQGTPETILVRCRNGAVYALPASGSGSPRLVADQIRALYPSAQPGRLAGYDAQSQIAILNLDGSDNQRALAARWRASHEPAALTADGKLWAVSNESQLWMAEADGDTFELADEGPISDIRPMGTALAAIETNKMELIGFNGAPPPPGAFAARRLLAVEGMALATDDTGNAVMWGPRVPESPRSFKLPEGAWQVRLGPTGLMVAW